MRRLLLLLLLFPLLLCADWDQILSDEEDPSLFHHVNVITGNLNLHLQDTVIEGPQPLPVFRTYTSAGALEKTRDYDGYLREFRGGLLIQGGWNLFSHANLLLEPARDKHDFKAYIAEKSGNLISYSYSHRKGKHLLYLKPDAKMGRSTGSLGARTNPSNNLLQINLRTGDTVLFLPNGGRSYYEGPHLYKHRFKEQPVPKYFFLLKREVLPNRQQIHYSYDSKNRLEGVAALSPGGTKNYSSLKFVYHHTRAPFEFEIYSSDQKVFHYYSKEQDESAYINRVESNCRPLEVADFKKGRSGIGSRMRTLHLANQLQFRATYYIPTSKTDAKRWRSHPEKRELSIDKVRMLEAPVGPQGQMLPIARFLYTPKYTDVRDVDNILTRYHHKRGVLNDVLFFDEKKQVHSSLTFLWDKTHLRSKAFKDSKGHLLFAKTFHYDEVGNVVREVLWGNLTGAATGPCLLQPDGTVTGAESYRKSYSYLPGFNVPLVEEEEEGLTYRYAYQPDTDLLRAKFTCDKERILLREFFFYNADHILIEEIFDDGSSSNPDDFSNVTERQIKRYAIHAPTGMPHSLTEFYWNPATHKEILLKKSLFTYSPQHRVHTEAIYDSTGTYRYTLTTDYDLAGHVVRKTTPLGAENSYHYDSQGNLTTSKEVGSKKKIFTYDAASRPIRCEEIDSEGHSKSTSTTYDAKGRILSQTDTQGNTTHQSYDSFGRCVGSTLPELEDEEGKPYTPILTFSYDALGNLASTTTPRGETTRTFYNSLRKPIRIIQPDGQEIHHFYTKSGTLARTLYPDNSEIHYTYDSLRRMTSKAIYSPSHERLSTETWVYNALHLLSHTDPDGLTTHFTYDGAGRKIAEEAEGRRTTFAYDALGFLERTTSGPISHIESHDIAGNVIAQWDEGPDPENVTHFTYDSEQRKVQAIRHTTQGDAIDNFAYDGEGRLSRHTDPHHVTTEFLYTEIHNTRNQRVLQKTTLDPLHNATVETYDALNHLVRLEKKNPCGNTIASESYFYDRAGNRAKRLATLFHADTPLKTLPSLWIYDNLGRLIQETEGAKKTTLYSYDPRGRLLTRTLPSGITLTYGYDGLDRPTRLISSDGTIHYHYFYTQGPHPTQIDDLVHNTTHTRSYNPFGDLLSETNPLGISLTWDYDTLGRCTQLTLPDHSQILYHYTGSHLTQVQRLTPDGTLAYAHHYATFDPNGHIAEEELIFNLGTLHTDRDLLERPFTQHSLYHQHAISYGPSGLVAETHNSLFGHTPYAYDSLNQLLREGTQDYSFDSLGNPTHCTLDDCNQLQSTPDTQFHYDPDGNPIQRIQDTETTHYTYDALGRLTTITSPTTQVQYTYDAFSRLLSKTTPTATQLYLYDKEHEIGILGLQLKVLGLGIKGDIGAAIALELEGNTYVPLHDFNGNIIALLSPSGTLVETYPITAFGKETTPSTLNPWRFSSKRSDENLIFFGKRFYDPAIGRWLTPDPAGFADGPNLYLYVRNSPLNRLDLFGLFSEAFREPLRIEISLPEISTIPATRTVLFAKSFVNGVQVDWVVSCSHWHKLQFTPSEIASGTVNIVDHFVELVPPQANTVGLITAQNGIHTSFQQFQPFCKSITEKVPEGTLFIGLHNPSKGFFSDANRLRRELAHKETSTIIRTRQFFEAICDTIHKINPSLIWLHIDHSEGALIARHAIEGMTPDHQTAMKEMLYSLNLGPVKPMPLEYAFRAFNYYSTKDYAVKTKPKDDLSYNINRIDCITPRKHRVAYLVDHSFLAPTYQGVLDNRMEVIRKEFQFYDPKTR